MKKSFIALSTFLTLVLASCGGKEATENATSTATQTASVNFGIDTAASSLKWKGSKSEEDFHVGSLKFKSGSLTAQGTDNVMGEFVVDMNSIKVEDKEMPDDKKAYLKKHLSDKDYFDVSKFPEVTVKVNGYKDGKLSSTVNVLGKEMKQDIPVKMTNDGSKVTISGNFEMDFKDLNLEGFKVNTEKPDETIKSVVNYELNLVLNKK
jgi:polyisoprenoid-binding protein YceI